jgi:hypothetical protein
MNFYLVQNAEAYLVKVLPDDSLQVQLRNGTTITFPPGSWRVMDPIVYGQRAISFCGNTRP